MMQLELEHFLTLHLRSRKFPSAAAYTETVQVLGRLEDYIRNNSQPGPSQQVFVIYSQHMDAEWIVCFACKS